MRGSPQILVLNLHFNHQRIWLFLSKHLQ